MSASPRRRPNMPSRSSGHDVVVYFQPQTGRRGDDLRTIRRVLRTRDRQRDGLHRWRRRHGADALPHLRPVPPPPHRPQGLLLVRRAQQTRGVLRRKTSTKINAENENFDWHLALSDPLPEDEWDGDTGFIHQVVYEKYLKDHPAPEDVEYYMCGPPMMNQACINMLLDLGVEPENIMLDDFGE